jgi:hypothetical protein
MAFKIPIQEEFLQVTGVVAWTKSFEQMDDFYSWETGVRFTSFILFLGNGGEVHELYWR